ncbi:hypothetical protein [Dyella agri]|uniref:Uncharacterized protein n=1 Tax=Dyella agri TaxID=1926869 RepID=A0ABW8KF27_9GAMM
MKALAAAHALVMSTPVCAALAGFPGMKLCATARPTTTLRAIGNDPGCNGGTDMLNSWGMTLG